MKKIRKNNPKNCLDERIWGMIIKFKRFPLPENPESEECRLRRLIKIPPKTKLEFLRTSNEFVFTFPAKERSYIRAMIDKITHGRVFRVN